MTLAEAQIAYDEANMGMKASLEVFIAAKFAYEDAGDVRNKAQIDLDRAKLREKIK
jgi:hypothetical protein